MPLEKVLTDEQLAEIKEQQIQRSVDSGKTRSEAEQAYNTIGKYATKAMYKHLTGKDA